MPGTPVFLLIFALFLPSNGTVSLKFRATLMGSEGCSRELEEDLLISLLHFFLLLENVFFILRTSYRTQRNYGESSEIISTSLYIDALAFVYFCMVTGSRVVCSFQNISIYLPSSQVVECPNV